MLGETEDIGTRVAGYMQQQVVNDKKTRLATKVQAQKKTSGKELTGTRKLVAGLLGLAVICVSIFFGYTNSRPPGVVRLVDLREQEETGRTMLVGNIKNTRSTTLTERTWSISYLDGDRKPALPEINLVIRDVKPGQTREWKVEVPGYRAGLTRVVRPKS
jgi:hypothetical protein